MTSTEKKKKLWFQPDCLPADMQFMNKTERFDLKLMPMEETKALQLPEKTLSIGSPLNSRRQNDSADSLNEENFVKVLETP